MAQLCDVLHYCHARAVKVYVALNTLLLDSELEEFADTVEKLDHLGADGVILQDLGALRLCRQISPRLPVHASTQMSVQSLEGLRLLADLGVTRAVLPRELSRDEIRRIVRNSPIETELFVHGALCSSLSGQCLLSSFFGGRSANRGECAQPCRLPFRRPGDTREGILSLKDLSLLDFLPELAAIGVSSFKIEGRMKRPEYVAAAVTACRQALEGNVDGELRKSLTAVFSRSGFTDGYYTGDKSTAMEGVRRKEDVVAASSVLPKLAALYAKEAPHFPVSFRLSAKADSAPQLTAICNEHQVTVTGDILERAVKPIDEERIKAQLAKCGGTQFFCSQCLVDVQEVHLPVSVLNTLRRECLASLEEKIAQHTMSLRRSCVANDNVSSIPQLTNRAIGQLPAEGIHIRAAHLGQIPKNLEGVTRLILPLEIEEIPRLPSHVLPAVELPRGVFGRDLKEDIRQAKKAGFALAIASGIDGAAAAIKEEMPFAMGLGSNVCNSEAIIFWENLGAADVLLSPELGQCRKLCGVTFAYGRLPLMLLRRNLGTKYLIDRKGKHFPLEHHGGYREVLACTPVALESDGAKLIYFTVENTDECEEILGKYRDGQRLKGELLWKMKGF